MHTTAMRVQDRLSQEEGSMTNPNKQDALKACPFCGATPQGVVKKERILGTKYIQILCNECATVHMQGTPVDSVIKLWNTRPIEADLRAKLAGIELANDVNRKEVNRLNDKLKRIKYTLKVALEEIK